MKHLLLAIPCVLSVAVPFYNFLDPAVIGFPMFFWFPIATIPFTSLMIYFAYRMERK